MCRVDIYLLNWRSWAIFLFFDQPVLLLIHSIKGGMASLKLHAILEIIG